MPDKIELPHNYVSFEDLLMRRHVEYPLTEAMAVNMARLWFRVNTLTSKYPATLPPNPVSSGYRPGRWNVAAGGAPASPHPTCEAVDVLDAGNGLDQWLDKNPQALVDANLWREDPAATNGWVHLDLRPRRNRTFLISTGGKK